MSNHIIIEQLIAEAERQQFPESVAFEAEVQKNSIRAMDELPGFESLPEVQIPCRFTGFPDGLANQSCHAARFHHPDHIAGNVHPDSAPGSGTQDGQYGVLPVEHLPDFHG